MADINLKDENGPNPIAQTKFKLWSELKANSIGFKRYIKIFKGILSRSKNNNWLA